MKKSRNITDFFHVKAPPQIACPACGLFLPKSKLNCHLDSHCSSTGCASKLPSTTSLSNTKISLQSVSKIYDSYEIVKSPSSSKSITKSNSKLSLKRQRKHPKLELSSVKNKNYIKSPEIITLDDDSGTGSVKPESTNCFPIFKNVDSTSFCVSTDNLLQKNEKTNGVDDVEMIECVPDIIYTEYETNYSKNENCNLSILDFDAPKKNNVDRNVDNQSNAKKLNTSFCHLSALVPQEKGIKLANKNINGTKMFEGVPDLDSNKSITDNCVNNKNIDMIILDDNSSNSLITSEQNLLKHDNDIKSASRKDTFTIQKTDKVPKDISQASYSTNFKHRPTKPKKLKQSSMSLNNTNPISKTNSIATSKTNLSSSPKVEISKDISSTSGTKDILDETDINNSDILALLDDAKESVKTDDCVFSENVDEDKKTENYSPYYIANFKHILDTVLKDEWNAHLFNEEDKNFINAFENLSDPCQKLYVRLFQRKYKWLRLSKINYPLITENPGMVLDQLVVVSLVESGLDNIDLPTALELLSLPEARNVFKQFNFNPSGKNKTDITKMLLKHSKEHKTVFFATGKNGVANMVLKKVRQVLGPCYRLSVLPKRLFTRILMLFSLPTYSEDDDDAAGGQQQQLLTLLQVNKGEVTFPDCKINRQTIIFTDRDELIRYEEAKQLENDILNAIESKNFELGKDLYINAKEEFEEQLLSPFVERAAALPTYLKKFTSFHVYIRCMTQGVEILQKMRLYKDAVELIRRILAQKVFCQDYRGRLFDRLALNLEQHLKQRQEALEVLREGLCDKTNIRVGHRYSLLTRSLRLLKSTGDEDEFKKEVFEAANVIEAPKVVIRGRLFPRNILGRRNVFISSSSTLENEDDDITILGVEQLAIEHYKSEGYIEGIHGEGSTFHSLYGLLFWDIIYDGDIPDAFISPYQTHPLDLNHNSFFERREKQILNHLELLKKISIEDIREIVKSTWEAHFNQSSLVFWDRFTDVEHILGLVSCMGNDLLCGICERLARDFRFTRSGVPDLVVWNPETLQVKIVEVKGPGDKLSSKQILWLDYLLKLGAQAEVCHIEPVASKKLQKE